MSYSRYLTALNTTLRQTVLPEVNSGRAKDAVNNAISVLGAIAANLERVAPEILASLDDNVLPDSLKPLAPSSAASGSSDDDGIKLPLSTPPDDFAQNYAAFPLIKAGTDWLATQPWPNDATLMKSAMALLKWESALRDDAIARVKRAEKGFVAAAASVAVPDISQPALEKYLRARLGSNEVRVTEFRFLAGGRNRQTALFAVEGTTAIPPRLVVQREPPTAMTTLSGIGMQFAVLQQAHAAGVRVALPVILELAPEALGAQFMITEQVGGSCPVPSMDYWSPPPKSDKLAASLAAQFAQIHRVPFTKVENVMERYVDPRKGQTWLSDVDAMEQQWRGMANAPSMAVTASLAWLRAHVDCVDDTEAIVHNDALLHNTLADNDEITAVLDWEMAHIGHPFEDLGYVRPVVEQMTDWSLFIDAYVAAGGRRPTPQQVDFFTLRSIIKLLIQVMHVRSAFDTGKADVPALAEIGASFLPQLIDRLAKQLNAVLARS